MKSILLVQWAGAVLFATLLAACGDDSPDAKTGVTTLPSGAIVSAAAKKPADHGALSATITKMASGACMQADVGLCGCLPKESYFSEGGKVYDIVCCDELGDNFNMHACDASETCDDSGAMVMCGAGSGH